MSAKFNMAIAEFFVIKNAPYLYKKGEIKKNRRDALDAATADMKNGVEYTISIKHDIVEYEPSNPEDPKDIAGNVHTITITVS